MEEEKLKYYWKMLNIMSQQNSFDMESLKKIVNDEMKQTSLNRLETRYKRFSIIAFLMIFIGFLYIWAPLFDSSIRYILGVVMMFYFMLCSCMDYYLYSRIKNINIYQMTTSEVLQKIITTRKLHFIFMSILLPIGVGIIVLITFAFPDNREIVWGVIAGAIIGLGIGLMKLMDFLRDYRNLISN